MDSASHKIKILYDYPSVNMAYGGVARYICEIMKVLHGEIEIKKSIFVTDNIYIRQLPFIKVNRFPKKFKGKQRVENMLNSIYANYKVLQNNFDIFHATFSDAYTLMKVKKPVIVTIHDMINESFPQFRKSHAKHIASKKKLIYESAHIIAVSENTKKDILQIYPIDPDKITVIHHGPPAIASKPTKNEWGDYILYVGRRGRYKNFSFFAESIVPILQKNPSFKLICAGPSFTQEEINFLNKLNILKQTNAIGATDEVLYSLYQNALVFVFPSIAEGFGIPILEAFANKCPICLSNTSCFPEIAGDAGIYFDPYNSKSIAESIEKIICDKNLAAGLKEKGLQRLSDFSWEKAAEKTLEIYQKVYTATVNS